MKEQFIEEYSLQEKEKEEAIAFFAPIDLALLALHRDVYRNTMPYFSENRVLQDILCDRLTERQRNNRFIQKVLRFLPEAKWIRGNRTFLTLMLRKLFLDEKLTLEPVRESRLFQEECPRYEDRVGGMLEDTFIGEGFPDGVCCFQVIGLTMSVMKVSFSSWMKWNSSGFLSRTGSCPLERPWSSA